MVQLRRSWLSNRYLHRRGVKLAGLLGGFLLGTAAGIAV